MSRGGVHALVPAAGIGLRFGGERPKQYIEIAGKPVLAHAIEAVRRDSRVTGVTVVIAADDRWFEASTRARVEPVEVVAGGATRAESVHKGLQAIARRHPQADWVLVHDAVRPCLSAARLAQLLTDGLASADGAILALPVRDTLKRCDAGHRIVATLDRASLWAAQTPQLFPLERLRAALGDLLQAGAPPTDEAAAMESAGGRPLVVMGSPRNIKITWPGDVAVAAAWLAGIDPEEEGL